MEDIFTDNPGEQRARFIALNRIPNLTLAKPEWHEENVKAITLPLVARLSSRIFLGEELCRNKVWLDITTSYTVDVMKAAERLRRVPGPLRRVVHWFLPEVEKCRTGVKRAGEVIRPVLEARRNQKAAMEARGEKEGEKAVRYNDAIEWFEQMARSRGTPYDPEVVQLFLSTVAIHTTSDLLTVVLVDLARNQEIIEPLREEITAVLRNGGWQKTSLTDMKLLDSVLKESLRLKPIAVGESLSLFFALSRARARSLSLVLTAQSQCAASLPTTSNLQTEPSFPKAARWPSPRTACGMHLYTRIPTSGTAVDTCACATSPGETATLCSCRRASDIWASAMASMPVPDGSLHPAS